jgi:hypothetical protein
MPRRVGKALTISVHVYKIKALAIKLMIIAQIGRKMALVVHLANMCLCPMRAGKALTIPVSIHIPYCGIHSNTKLWQLNL